jgi:uncharacterized protein
MDRQISVQPVAPTERILALDVLRGFAMFGVLVAYAMWSLGTAPEETFSPLDRALAKFTGFAIDGKFYTVLAFLFGLGFALQLDRAKDDATAVRVYMRRLAALAAIGLAHSLLLRNGDILLPYAITGFLMIPLRKASDGVVLAVALVMLLVPEAARLAWEASGVPLPQRPQLEGASYLAENFAWVRYWYATAPFNWPVNLTLFLFGLYAGRRRLLAALAQDRPRLVVILGAGLVAGTLLYWLRLQWLAEPTSTLERVLASLLFTFHCWVMSSAYVAGLLILLRTRAAAVLLPLAAIGRLALTNYLLQAALLVPLCLALGLFDRFTPSISYLVAFALFGIVQIPFSLLWLRRYRFGPAEWVWRLLAYGRVPPLRLAQGDYAPV